VGPGRWPGRTESPCERLVITAPEQRCALSEREPVGGYDPAAWGGAGVGNRLPGSSGRAAGSIGFPDNSAIESRMIFVRSVLQNKAAIFRPFGHRFECAPQYLGTSI
jgi:hypothetical protein